ncbi:MAG: hypothetical protein CVV27_15235 [Candidatus Melainabacteria bacterium HGW-Melainabacteria-1]|nr:MAG: hypothetical protein CVV27_15235 [Candidatus Melainabacteria bacterium HGW-Melainabacteria-1]
MSPILHPSTHRNRSIDPIGLTFAVPSSLKFHIDEKYKRIPSFSVSLLATDNIEASLSSRLAKFRDDASFIKPIKINKLGYFAFLTSINIKDSMDKIFEKTFGNPIEARTFGLATDGA